MNVSDSDFMAAHMESLGYTAAETIDQAAIIIVNTCSVRAHPENAALSFVGRAEPFKRKDPSVKIIFAGCTAQRLQASVKKRFPAIDLVVGAREIESFPELLKGILGNRPKARSAKNRPAVRNISAFVPIMRGCENFCAYCVVPLVRGPEISRPAGEILKEIKRLAKNGVKEVTLLGQNVNSYRGSLELGVRSSEKSKNTRTSTPVDFPELLEMINSIKGIERIRFMTSHPKDLKPKLINAMARLEKVCEHLHLPLQSGSGKVLKSMNRGYTASDYLSKIAELKRKIPGISLTTDILVGFPGESDRNFSETLKMINKAGYDSLFGFKYSVRPGTSAAMLEDNVPLAKKEKRLDKVLELGNRLSAQKNAKLIQTVQEVLVESAADGFCSGSTRQNKKVAFEGGSGLIGTTVKVRVTNVKVNSLSGDIV